MYRNALYVIALIWINAYICRDFFLVEHTGHMNAMHGFWMSIARLASRNWWFPGWWPYWDAGMPVEWTYAPLVPALTSAWAGLAGVSVARAFHSISGVLYVLTPVVLFAMAAALSRNPGWSFIAAVVYSLSSLTQIIIPDESFAWSRIWDARRLYLVGVWDETPHIAALNAILLALLFTGIAILRQRTVYWVFAGAFMCLAMLANAFGLTALGIGLLSLLLAFGRERSTSNMLRMVATVVVAYLIACPAIPPSLFSSISTNQQFHGAVRFDTGSFTALGIVVLGIIILAAVFHRFRTEWWLRFIAYFTWIFLSVPLISIFLDRSFLPQSVRYKIEAEVGLALIVVFGARALIEMAPAYARIALAIVGLYLATDQVISHRRFAKANLKAMDYRTSIEYRAATWASEHLPDSRVWYTGSLGQWFSAWSDGQQMTGSSWSTAYNPMHQKLIYQSLYSSVPEDVRNAFLWLRAYGVQAVAIPGRKSPEFWKAIGIPELFSGCEVLWREDDTAICNVPGSSSSFAHAIQKEALILQEPRDWRDATPAQRLDSALDRATSMRWRWNGTNAAQASGEVSAGQVVTVQVTHHPGWSATANGKPVALQRDGLGLMWLDPGCRGPCELQLRYSGGLELRLCRWTSALTVLSLVALALRRIARWRN